MKRTRNIAMKFLVLLATAVAIPTVATPAEPAANPLAPIAFLAGSTWRGQLPPAPDGSTAPALETTFAWMENGRAMRFDTIAVAGERRSAYTSGIYAWHPGKRAIVFLYTDSRGALTEGSVTVEESGGLMHEFTVAAADGAVATYRALVSPDGKDAYWNEIFQQESGEWKAFVKVHYERK